MIKGHDGASVTYIPGLSGQRPPTPQSAAFGPVWFGEAPPVRLPEPIDRPSALTDGELDKKRFNTFIAIAAVVAVGILAMFCATSPEKPPSQPDSYSTNY